MHKSKIEIIIIILIIIIIGPAQGDGPCHTSQWSSQPDNGDICVADRQKRIGHTDQQWLARAPGMETSANADRRFLRVSPGGTGA